MKSTLDNLVKKTAGKLNYWQTIAHPDWPDEVYLYPKANGKNVDLFLNGEIIVHDVSFENIPGWALRIWRIRERMEGTDNACKINP